MVVLHLRGEGARSANRIGNVGLPRRRLRRHEADRVEGLERVLHRESLLRVEVVVTKPLRFGSEGRLPRFLVRLPRTSSRADGPAEAKKGMEGNYLTLRRKERAVV